MTIEQANQYFAALPDGFASTEQLRAAFTAPVQKVQVVGVAGTAGKTVTARLLAAILHAQGIHAGLNERLGAGVDRAGRLVENEHRRQAEHDTRDAKKLLLSL